LLEGELPGKQYKLVQAWIALHTDDLFVQVRVAHNTVVWNEEVDIAPESLYLESTPI